MTTPLLDTIIDEQQQLPLPPTEPANGHSFKDGMHITPTALANLSKAAPPLYRGNGTDVTAASNNVPLIREMSGLTWDPVKVKAAAIGSKGGVVHIPDEFWLFKSKTTSRIPVRSVTADYKPHTNEQVLKMMAAFAEDAGIVISHVGVLDGGARIWASAEVKDVTAETVVGDVFGLRIMLQTGHGCGIATKGSVHVLRLVCNNGAFLMQKSAEARVTHSANLTELRIERAAVLVAAGIKAFHDYMARLRPLYQVPATTAVIRLALAQLLISKDEDWRKVVRNVAGEAAVEEQKTERRIGAATIERLLVAESATRNFAARMFNGVATGNLLNSVLIATTQQVGGDLSRGTLAHPLNGLTYYDSHLRGQADPAGVRANGVRAALANGQSSDLMDLLETQYAPAIRQVMGRAA